MKLEQKGKWVEFEIDKDSFEIEYGNADCPKLEDFGWWDWQGFLSYCRQEGLSFTAFGGWQYENSKRWYLAPAVKLQDGDLWNSYVIEESGEATPVIPVKIRFWKEK